MDYSKFTADDFQPKDWINNLISMISSENLEKNLMDIIIKLQYYMQEMNAVVDESTQTAFQSLPRILREMENVRQESAILQEQMSLIKCDIEKVEKSTQDSMYKLIQIDEKKKKLSQIENALQEADSWTQICENIDNIMKSGDIDKIADKIASLQHSLTMLSKNPDFEDRKKTIHHLCENFESLLGPQLVNSFFNNDSDFIRRGLDLLKKINRLECGSKFYIAWFKPSVEEIWNQCKNYNQWKTAGDLLKLFYENLIKFCNQELEKHLFNNIAVVLIDALIESLSHLQEQFEQIINKTYPEISDIKIRINIITKCIEVTDSFCEQLEESIQKNCCDIQLLDKNLCLNLSKILYKQYIGVDDIFVRQSAFYVQQQLNEIKMDSSDVSESIDILNVSIDNAMDLARESVKFSQSMTHFTGIDGLVDCLKDLFTNYILEFKRVCLNIILKLSNQQSVSSDKSDNTDTGIDDYYFLQDGILLTSLGGYLSVSFDLFLQEMLSQITNHIQKLQSIQSKTNIFFRKYSIVLIESHAKQIQITELWTQISNIDSQIELLKYPNFKSIEDTRQNIKFKLCRWLNKKVFEHAIEPIKKNLYNIHKSAIWDEELDTGVALPQFAFSPQEYITKIGQFFMTLPQQLEPFFNNSSKYYQESLVNGQLPHMGDIFFKSWLESSNKGIKNESSNILKVAHVWLESIVSECLTQLLDQWLTISKLSVNGKRQLQADLNYINGVVEDLDLQMLTNINLFSKLIVATSKDELIETAAIYNIEDKMVEIVKRMIF